MNNSKVKRTMIFCEPCGYKSIIEPKQNPDELTEIVSAKIQAGIPQLEGNKTVTKPFIERPKMYKCPKCGRGVRVKELLAPYAKAMSEIDQKKELDRLEADKLKRIEDGKPKEKPSDPVFLG